MREHPPTLNPENSAENIVVVKESADAENMRYKSAGIEKSEDFYAQREQPIDSTTSEIVESGGWNNITTEEELAKFIEPKKETQVAGEGVAESKKVDTENVAEKIERIKKAAGNASEKQEKNIVDSAPEKVGKFLLSQIENYKKVGWKKKVLIGGGLAVLGITATLTAGPMAALPVYVASRGLAVLGSAGLVHGLAQGKYEGSTAAKKATIALAGGAILSLCFMSATVQAGEWVRNTLDTTGFGDVPVAKYDWVETQSTPSVEEPPSPSPSPKFFYVPELRPQAHFPVEDGKHFAELATSHHDAPSHHSTHVTHAQHVDTEAHPHHATPAHHYPADYDKPFHTEALALDRNGVYTVKGGDNLTSILSRGIPEVSGFSQHARENVIQNLIQKMSPAELTSIGITSSDVDILHPGDHINLNKVHELITDAKGHGVQGQSLIDHAHKLFPNATPVSVAPPVVAPTPDGTPSLSESAKKLGGYGLVAVAGALVGRYLNRNKKAAVSSVVGPVVPAVTTPPATPPITATPPSPVVPTAPTQTKEEEEKEKMFWDIHDFIYSDFLKTVGGKGYGKTINFMDETIEKADKNTDFASIRGEEKKFFDKIYQKITDDGHKNEFKKIVGYYKNNNNEECYIGVHETKNASGASKTRWDIYSELSEFLVKNRIVL